MYMIFRLDNQIGIDQLEILDWNQSAFDRLPNNNSQHSINSKTKHGFS